MITLTNTLADTDRPTTNMGARLLRGDTYEYECGRTSARMTTALAILKSQEIVAERTHSDNKVWDWPTSRDRHLCDRDCTITWPEWVTGSMFDLAYQMADAIRTQRGRAARRGVSSSR